MTNAHIISISAIGWGLAITPWWHGLFFGASVGVLACLLCDVIEGLIRALVGGSRHD